jgi:flagellar protein FlbD
VFAREVAAMIKLTRLNNQPLAVNADLIKFVEQAPDTVLTLVTGEKVVVRESAEEVMSRFLAFRQAVVAPAIAMIARPAETTDLHRE